MIGIFYVVSTPIGNLEDITLRALRVLKEVDCILCEDKRVTAKLLNKYQIKTKLISFHRFNEASRANKILSIIKNGQNVALVSDAGTPLLSDPGLSLISVFYKSNINIVSVPGPSALTAALSLCPYKLDEFLFVGFLPDSKNERKKLIESLNKRAKAVIIFLAPHDFNKYLNEIFNLYPSIDVFYAREITKMYEEHWSGKLKDLLEMSNKKKIRGEIVLCLDFHSVVENGKNHKLNNEELVDLLKSYISKGYSLKQASKNLAKEFNLSSKVLYDLYIKTESTNKKPLTI